MKHLHPWEVDSELPFKCEELSRSGLQCLLQDFPEMHSFGPTKGYSWKSVIGKNKMERKALPIMEIPSHPFDHSHFYPLALSESFPFPSRPWDHCIWMLAVSSAHNTGLLCRKVVPFSVPTGCKWQCF